MISQEDIFKHIKNQIIIGWITSASGQRGPYVQTFDIAVYQDTWYIAQKYRLDDKDVWHTLISGMETAAIECGIELYRLKTAGGMVWKIKLGEHLPQDVLPAFMKSTQEKWMRAGCPRSKMNLRHHDRMLWQQVWRVTQ